MIPDWSDLLATPAMLPPIACMMDWVATTGGLAVSGAEAVTTGGFTGSAGLGESEGEGTVAAETFGEVPAA